MTPQHHLPADIERTSLSIITAELDAMGLTPPPETAAVVKRVIHTTADFDYARNLRFTPGAVAAGVAALQAGERDAHRLRAMMQAMIAAEPLARLDYISVAHPRTLAELVVVEDGAVLSTAVFFHRTRLIDNMLWHA